MRDIRFYRRNRRFRKGLVRFYSLSQFVRILADFLREQAGAKRRFGAVPKLALAIEENPEIAEMIQQLVMAKQIVRILRMADFLLVDRVGFEDHVTAGSQRANDLRDQRSLQIIDIHNQIILRRRKLDILQVSFLPSD